MNNNNGNNNVKKNKHFPSNNKYPDCPPRMDDARHFTDYRPNRDINNLIRLNNDIVNSHTYRSFLTRNGQKIIDLNKKMSCVRNCCGPCKNDSLDVTSTLSNNTYYNLNKFSELEAGKLGNNVSANQQNKAGIVPSANDGSTNYCAFDLSNGRSQYNKAQGYEYADVNAVNANANSNGNGNGNIMNGNAPLGSNI